MSEASEKVLGIKHLPVFPLPLVLLPNEMLPLHIFEPRYRQMLADVRTEKNLLGVSHFNPVDRFVNKPEIGTVGCVAEILDAQTMPDGRSNIMTAGVIRYRLLDYVEAAEPYLVGDVEFFEDFEENQSELNLMADEVFLLFTRIADAAHKLSGASGAPPEIARAEPQTLSFLVTAAFNLEADLKYRLLETRSTIERLTKMREILFETVDKMEENAETRKTAKTNGHSKKKIEF